MDMLKIVKDTNPKLRRKCDPVETPLDEENEAIALSLLSYLKDSQDPDFLEKHPKVRSGVGLAAPQVGVSRRMIAVYFEDEDGKEICHVLANPKILASSVRQCYLAGGEGNNHALWGAFLAYLFTRGAAQSALGRRVLSAGWLSRH